MLYFYHIFNIIKIKKIHSYNLNYIYEFIKMKNININILNNIMDSIEIKEYERNIQFIEKVYKDITNETNKTTITNNIQNLENTIKQYLLFYTINILDYNISSILIKIINPNFIISYDTYKETPLMRVIYRYGSINFIKLLIDNGADIYVFNNYPLKLAIRFLRVDVVKLLFELKSVISSSDPEILEIFNNFYCKRDSNIGEKIILFKILINNGLNKELAKKSVFFWSYIKKDNENIYNMLLSCYKNKKYKYDMFDRNIIKIIKIFM